MKTHHLKTWPSYFNAVWTGEKNFEVRLNDRDFSTGDELVLKEFDPENGDYTGRHLSVLIKYIMAGGRFGIDADHCVLGIDKYTTNDTK